MRLAATLDGPPDAPALVLSGGLGTTTGMWREQLPQFTPRFRVLRVDHPGHGRSPAPEGPVEVADIGRAVLSLLDEHGIDRASVCGLSLGGMVALWLAVEAPERVDAVVLACTGAKLGERAAYDERAALVRTEGVEATVEGARERWFTTSFSDGSRATEIIEELRATPAEGYAACCEAVGRFDFRDRLGEISAPALVVYGADDPVTPPDVVETLEQGLRDVAVVRLERAAHLANVEQPDAFADAVVDFLERKVAG